MADAVQDKKLFPDLPESLADLSDTEIEDLEREHVDAAESIRDEDEEFLKGLSAEEILAELKRGVEQTMKIHAYREEAAAEYENYRSSKDAELAKIFGTPVEVEAEAEVVSEEDDSGDEDDGAVTEEAEEKELVLASADPEPEPEVQQVKVRRSPPPAPSPDRIPVEEPAGTPLLASGEMSHQFQGPLNPDSLALMVQKSMQHHGPMPKIDPPGKFRFGGPEHKIARAEFDFPPERTLTGDPEENSRKIRDVVVASIPGGVGGYSLTASGGLCAPSTPIYTMPNFATQAEPVWDSLPKFRANRGGVNVPTATYIGDITTAISSISEANDALGGTFATKSCQALECPAYTETLVQILAHCREYGNLNAIAWPEKIAHENELTMAALARTSEDFMLEGIKALSVNVTNGLETLGALIYLVDAIVKSAFGIRGRLRMPANARFRALLPSYTLDLLVLDTIQTQFDRFRTKEDINAYLRAVGIDPVYYIDGNFAAGDDQLPDASQAAGAIDGLPNTVQWAIYPEGAFIGVDMGTLELGIVRDSTLNATNDFQVFGEEFRNVARLAPAQACYWVTTDWCPVGQFPPAGTARTCE